MIVLPEKFRKYLPFAGLALLILIALTPGIYFYNKYRQTQKILSASSDLPSNELQQIISKVGNLIELPQNETPTLATVTDKDRLTNQPFFANSKNGDKVLIYPDSKKAYLFRPSSGKLVEVAPVNVSSPSATPQSNVQEFDKQSKFSVILYNGTKISGLTRTYENQIKKDLPNMEVIERENASKNDYQKSVLVALKGNQTDKAEQLAGFLGLSLQSMPDGEAASPSADFLIILGTDKSV